jgi:GT2 family glycosyltransferase
MRFSIIVATYNRSASLSSLLISLSKLKYDTKNFEVIVVDNNSNDETKMVFQSFSKQHLQLDIRYFFERRQGKSFAVNKVLDHVKYSHVILVDDDIILDSNFLAEYKVLFEKNPQASIIGGKIEAIVKGQKRLRSERFKHLSRTFPWLLGEVDFGKKIKELVYPECVLGGNLAINISHFKKPIFDESLGVFFKGKYIYADDFELCTRAMLNGLPVFYSPKPLVKNLIDPFRFNFRYLFKRHILSGLERRFLDDKFKNNLQHLPYEAKKEMNILLEELKIKSKFWKNFENKKLWLLKFAFIIGYSFLGPGYLKKDWRTNFFYLF